MKICSPFAGDAAIGAQVRGDRLAQRPIALRLAIAQDDLPRAAPVLGRQARPLRHRKRVERRHRGGEGPRLMRPAGARTGRVAGRHHAREPLRRRRGSLWPGACAAIGRSALERPADVGARADPRFDRGLRRPAGRSSRSPWSATIPSSSRQRARWPAAARRRGAIRRRIELAQGRRRAGR